ncbi:hypothetical protein SAMN04488075_0836 [Paracoccus alkenifer]|uniref:Uncharacterized protein n=1 Tax=Paracoccus alkenifer TaxID=65735 RepID=A0A1H6K994_9RHOB|nr:hypothetical protein SAMN04488075_0836 [Paracoccus alkenifer]
MTIYQPVGCEPDPNCCAFSCGPHLRWVSASCAGFHLGGKLLGRSFLHPSLAMIVAQHDGAVEQGEADPRSVGREQGQDRPQEHVLEQLVERAEQQGSQAAPVAQDGFRLAVEGPRRAYRHDPIASLEVFDASAIRLGTVTRQGNSRAVEEDHRVAMPMHRARVDGRGAGMTGVSAAHSAPAGIARGTPCLRHAPALLAHCNAAARAFRSRSSGLFTGHSELHTSSPPYTLTCFQINRCLA